MDQAAAPEELPQKPDNETKSKEQCSDDIGESNNESNDVMVIEQEPSQVIVISSDDEDDIIDDTRSRNGQFGWVYIKPIKYVPVIYRSGMKYIWETTLVLAKNGTLINVGDKKVMATQAEVELLKEINSFHCNNHYKFMKFYYLVSMSHVKEILEKML